MKRLLPLLLALLLCVSCAAPKEAAPAAAPTNTPSPYEAAEALVLSGNYAAAAEAFSALTGVNDAPQMAIYCRGMALKAEGDYARAQKAFAQLEGFKDAAVQLQLCQGLEIQAKADAIKAEQPLSAWPEAIAALEEAAACFDELDYLPEAERLAAAARADAQALQNRLDAVFFDRLGDSAHGLCAVERNGLWGVVNRDGALVVPCEWDDILAIGPGVIVVMRDGLCGLLSPTGEELYPCTAKSCQINGYLWALYLEESTLEFDPVTGAMMPEGHTIYRKANGLFILARDGKAGVWNPATGAFVVPCEYDGGFAEDGAIYCYNEENSEEASDTQYATMVCYSPTGKTYRITENELLDGEGRVLLRAKGIGSIFDGRYVACLSETDEWSICDLETGAQLSVPEDGDYAGLGLFALADGEGYRLVDITGRRVTEELYTYVRQEDYDDEFGSWDSSFLIVEQDGLAGVMDASGRMILPCEYTTNLRQLNEYYLAAEKESGWGLYTLDGVELVPCGQQYSDFVLTGVFWRMRGGNAILNRRGDVVLALDDQASSDMDWAASADRLFVLRDGLLTILDEAGTIVNQ